MNAVFKATSEGQEFDIEITRDGELIFLDYDIELDLLRAELGEPPTTAVRLADEWKQERSQFFYKIGLSRKDLLLLASDWVRHVLPIYEVFYNSRDRRPREALYAINDYLNGKINLLILEEFRAKVKKAFDQSGEKWEVPSAILDIMYELTFDRRRELDDLGIEEDLLFDVSRKAASVAGYSASRFSGTPEFFAAMEQEKKWQTRRFVDIFSRLQAGKKWTRLKVTK